MGDLDYSERVSPLINLGEPETPWPDYPARFGLTREDIPELTRMAMDEHTWVGDPEDASVYSNVHAWRALGQLHAIEAIPALLSILRWGDELDDDWVSTDLPLALGMIGPEAIPNLAAYLADSQHQMYARATAADALLKIQHEFPETREACVAAIRATLENYPENDETLNGLLVADLAELKAVETAPLVEQVFQAGRVEEFIMGDWEDFQVEVGLLKERITPLKSNPHNNILSQLAWGEQRGVTKEDKKTKNKRKQEKASRKKNRKKKR